MLSLSEALNPPSWVRVLGLAWLPMRLGGVPIAYSVARAGDGRTGGRLGVRIALIGLVAFVELFITIG